MIEQAPGFSDRSGETYSNNVFEGANLQKIGSKNHITSTILDTNPFTAESGVNPLQHFSTFNVIFSLILK